jgi:putative DNA primase/helicase
MKRAEKVDLFRKTRNPLFLFLEEQCVLGGDYKVGTVELYNEYIKWCWDSGNRPLSRNKFQDQILRKNPSIDKRFVGPEQKRRRGFVGIGLNEHTLK